MATSKKPAYRVGADGAPFRYFHTFAGAYNHLASLIDRDPFCCPHIERRDPLNGASLLALAADRLISAGVAAGTVTIEGRTSAAGRQLRVPEPAGTYRLRRCVELVRLNSGSDSTGNAKYEPPEGWYAGVLTRRPRPHRPSSASRAGISGLRRQLGCRHVSGDLARYPLGCPSGTTGPVELHAEGVEQRSQDTRYGKDRTG